MLIHGCGTAGQGRFFTGPPYLVMGSLERLGQGSREVLVAIFNVLLLCWPKLGKNVLPSFSQHNMIEGLRRRKQGAWKGHPLWSDHGDEVGIRKV